MAKLLVEKINEGALLLERDKAKLPEGVLVRATYPICNVGQLNHNGRKYGKDLWERVLSNKDLQEKLENRTLFGHAEHPEVTQSNLEKTSHIISQMWLDEAKGKVYQTMDVVNTPYGQILNTLLLAGSKVGVSTRAEGELQEAVDEAGNKFMNVVAETFRYVTTDFTADPSTYNVLPENVERDVVAQIKTGIESKKMDPQFAAVMLESMKSTQARTLLESIKASGVPLSETVVNVQADGGVNVQAGDVSVNLQAQAAPAPVAAPVVPAPEPAVSTPAGQSDILSSAPASAIETVPVSHTSGSTVEEEPSLEETRKVLEDLQKELNKVDPKDWKSKGMSAQFAHLHKQKKSAASGSTEGKPSAPKPHMSTGKEGSKLQFESWNEMLRFLETEIEDPKSEVKRRLSLSESKVVLESQKEIKDLRIQVAEAVADRDRLAEALEIIQTKNAFLESRTSKNVKELRARVMKAENLLKESYQVNAKLRSKADKLVEAEKCLADGLSANQKLVKENKELGAQITALNEFKITGLVKKYTEAKISQIGFTLPNNALTLLEACKTEAEVDTLIEQFRDVMREDSLHSDVSGEKTVVTEKVKATPADHFEHSVGELYGALR